MVSGDFYWLTEHEGRVYFATCDCTGHGVPGAFMSMLNSSLLTEAVADKGIQKPNEIFYEVRKGFINALKQTGEKGQQKDGMDAALFAWDKKEKLQILLQLVVLHTVFLMINFISRIFMSNLYIGKL